MAHTVALFRPAAVLAAALLLAGLVPAGPAAAAPVDGPALSVTVFPSPEMPFWPGLGESPEHPAYLGPMPGAVVLRANISNTGTETLRDFTVTTRLAPSSTARNVGCDYNPEGVHLPPGDGPILLPGLFAQCWGLGFGGVMDDAVADLVTTVTARGAESGTEVTVIKHYYAIAEDESDKVGDRVWLDTDRDGVQDTGEPGIAGVRLTVAGPDGRPAADLYHPGEQVGPQTTDADGHYLFTSLYPISDGERYSVTVDPGSPALQGLRPTLSGVGSVLTDSSTGTGQSSEWMGGEGSEDTSVDFGFVTAEEPPAAPVKAAVTLVANASPETVTRGKKIKVLGTIRRDGKKYRATTVLEFRSDTDADFSVLKKVKSSSKGALSATVKATRSGTFRYRYAGNATTRSGTSNGDHVVVRPKPKTYVDCTALRRVYPHGVGRSGAVDLGGGVTDFTRDTTTYKRNLKSDLDRDGIACEQ